LQNQGGGYLIHNFAVLLARVSGFIEDLVGFAGGEALVPHMDGPAGQGTQFGSKGLGLQRSGTYVSREMERVTNHNSRHVEAPAEAGQRAKVLAGIVAALQGQDRLRRQAKFVGDGHADTFRSNVETEVARMKGGFQN
jgi:hypothetical protein